MQDISPRPLHALVVASLLPANEGWREGEGVAAASDGGGWGAAQDV